jgi:hypothetical protein
MKKHKHQNGGKLQIQENFYMNFNRVCSVEIFNVKYDDVLESGWIHDVAFSPLGDNLAWVSHNSIIFAVSSDNPSRLV